MSEDKKTGRRISSVRLSAIIIRLAAALCAVSLFIMPYAAKLYETESFYKNDIVTVPLLITFYSCAAIGFAILFMLDRLIGNIQRGEVFVDKNITLLRRLSWCCFGIAFITLLFARLRILVFVVTFAAAFFGLILRVIKNCFEEAVRLREENDFTI